MKKFKTIDTWVSIVLLVAFAILSLIRLDYTFLVGYGVVGAWQMMSMIVHIVKGWFTHRKAGRHYYHLVIAALAAILLIGVLVQYVLFFVMIGLLFAAPFMAVYYTWLCYDEVYVRMQRPLAALK